MAKIRQAIEDVLTRLATLDVVDGNGNNVKLYSRVFNNQIQYEEDGKTYDYPKPAAFIEILNGVTWEILGEGYRKADLGFRIHLAAEYYNLDGTLEQDLLIFDLRDAVISLLHLYKPVGCGALTCIREEQDYEHRNIYHYILEFVAAFIDDAGNVVKNFIESDPPTELIITKNPE